jgi:hypothetical protein
VISGFGINVDWDWDKNETPNGHTMPFMQALAIAVQGMRLYFILPRWLLSFGTWKPEGVRGHDELEVGHLSTFHQWPNPML